jgi:hypothetical protein
MKKQYSKVPKQIISKYTAPIKIRFSNGEEFLGLHEESGKPLIIKKKVNELRNTFR